jgi:choline/glycine/proline betaine transport protein
VRQRRPGGEPGVHRAEPFGRGHRGEAEHGQRRLALILNAPKPHQIERFIESSATPALESVAAELTKRGREARVEQDGQTGAASLVSPAEGVRDFVYGVQMVEHKMPAFSAAEAARMEKRYEARTFFSDGSRGYDIMGMRKEQIIADVLAQFERYLVLVQSTDTSLVAAAPEHG